MSREKKPIEPYIKDRETLYAYWATMPDEFLREKYRVLKRRQRWLAGIPFWAFVPAMTIYGIIGWGEFFASEYVQFTASYMTTINMMFPILFLIAGIFLVDKEPRHLIRAPIIFGIGVLMRILLYIALPLWLNLQSSLELPLYVPLMELYLIGAVAVLRPTVSDLNFLRSLPAFPFDARRLDLDLSGMSRDQVLQVLEAAANGQTVIEVGGHETLTADDPEAVVSPPEQTEEYLQQHKMIYKNK